MFHSRVTFILFFFVINVRGQDKPGKKMYFILKAGPSFLFTKSVAGSEIVGFPYSIKPGAGGNSRDSAFVSNPFAPLKSIQTAIYFTLEIGNRNQFFEVNFGGYTSSDNGAFLGVGYGRNIYLNLFGKHGRGPVQKDFVFRPSLHITYNDFNNTIGSIDNLNKYIYIGPYTSGPTFTESVTSGDNFSTTSTTYTTQSLNIAYLQRSCVLGAQIAFGNNQYKHLFHWEIIAGAYLSVAESIGVKFIQEASGDTQQSSSFYTIGSAMTSAMFNGKNITTAPFRFSGFRIGFNVGVSTGPPAKYKTKKNKASKM